MPAYLRTTAEIEEALVEQRAFLRRSCRSYDDGNFAEARRMATAVHVILHDTEGRTRSLLTQLGLKQTLLFVSSATSMTDTFPKLALAGVTGLPGQRAEVLPWCANSKRSPTIRHVSFGEWWGEPVFQECFYKGDGKKVELGKVLTRMKLVRSLRDQDNGSHFDRSIDDRVYVNFAIARTIGIYKTDTHGNSIPFINPHLASMRQIAWEIEETLKSVPGGPEIPPLDDFPPKPFRIDANTEYAPETISTVPPKSH